MDEATSRLAMELESVPTEIDQVQRRLMQLELAQRQLAEETEDHAVERREEIEAEMKELRYKLANLREQWEAEKQGVGNVAETSSRLQQVELQYSQLWDCPARQASGRRRSPPRTITKNSISSITERSLACQTAGNRRATAPAPATTGRRLAPPGSRPGRTRRGCKRLDWHPRDPDDGNRAA